MAEATTGNNLSGLSQNTGIVSRISSSISNVRKITSDPAVQKSIPLIFGVIVAFIGLIVFFTMQKSDMTTLFASLPESEKAAVIQTLKTKWCRCFFKPNNRGSYCSSSRIP